MGDKTTIITLDELAKHKTKGDAWMAIRGKVYDITDYICKHPGGESPILKYAGKDGTKAFDSVHPYVKPDSILSNKQKGILEGAKNVKSTITKASLVNTNDKASNSCCCFKGGDEGYSDQQIPTTEINESPGAMIYEARFKKSKSSELEWTVGIIDKQYFMMRKIVNKSDVWIASFQFPEPLTDDTLKVNFKDKYRCCRATITKPIKENSKKWESMGTPQENHNTIVDSRSTSDSYDACLVYKKKLACNAYMFGFRLSPSAHFGIPIGFHVKMYLDGESRNYTVVCFSMMNQPEPSNLPGGQGQVVWFIIKITPGGKLTPKLEALEPEQSKYKIKLGSPQGSFDRCLLFDRSIEVVFLLAGGSGITPMVRIIQSLKGEARSCCNRGRQVRVVLIYWNRLELEIIWNNKFEELATLHKWFHYVPVLTNPSADWKGKTGRPTKEQIEDIMSTLPKQVNSGPKQGYVCGSTGFNTAAESAISDIVGPKNVHIFEG